MTTEQDRELEAHLKAADDFCRPRIVDVIRKMRENAEDLRAHGAKARQFAGIASEIIACAHEDAADAYDQAAAKIESKYKAILVTK